VRVEKWGVSKNNSHHRKRVTQDFYVETQIEKKNYEEKIYYNPLVTGFTEIVSYSFSAGFFQKKNKRASPFSLEDT